MVPGGNSATLDRGRQRQFQKRCPDIQILIRHVISSEISLGRGSVSAGRFACITRDPVQFQILRGALSQDTRVSHCHHFGGGPGHVTLSFGAWCPPLLNSDSSRGILTIMGFSPFQHLSRIYYASHLCWRQVGMWIRKQTLELGIVGSKPLL